MSDLYLIAHKVRGEPAFDVAERMECPECTAQGCTECDQLGYWWIIPTSGHRAYPFWNKAMPVETISSFGIAFRWVETTENFPVILFPVANWPDHYLTSAAPDKPKLNLAALMPKAAPIRRRV